MGHTSAIVYQAYMNRRIQSDVQAAFLGLPSSDAILKATSHMARFADPRAPTSLTPSDLTVLKQDPEIVKLRKIRDKLTREIKEKFKTIKEAREANNEMCISHARAQSDLNSAKFRIREQALKKKRVEFHENIDTEELDKQDGSIDTQKNNWIPAKVEHQLEERRRVVELLCQQSSDYEVNLRHRIDMIEALIALCRAKKIHSSQKRITDNTWGIIDSDISTSLDHNPRPETTNNMSTPDSIPEICPSTQCPQCRAKICTPYKTKKHVERMHLRFYQLDEPIPCLLSPCATRNKVCKGHIKFKQHTERKHKHPLFPQCGQWW